MEILNRADRASQFAPFDALKGFREALSKKERIIVPKAELTEDRKEELDRILCQIQPGDMITIVYFHEGIYEKITGLVSKFSKTSRSLSVVNTTISFDDIMDIQGNFMDW